MQSVILTGAAHAVAVTAAACICMQVCGSALSMIKLKLIIFISQFRCCAYNSWKNYFEKKYEFPYDYHCCAMPKDNVCLDISYHYCDMIVTRTAYYFSKSFIYIFIGAVALEVFTFLLFFVSIVKLFISKLLFVLSRKVLLKFSAFCCVSHCLSFNSCLLFFYVATDFLFFLCRT